MLFDESEFDSYLVSKNYRKLNRTSRVQDKDFYIKDNAARVAFFQKIQAKRTLDLAEKRTLMTLE